MLQSQLFKTYYATGNPSVQENTGAIWILETSSSFFLKGVIQCVIVTNQCEDPYLVLTQSGDASSCWGSSRCWFQLVCKCSNLPEKRTCCTWKTAGCVRIFLSGRLSGRCHVSFRECKPSNTYGSHNLMEKGFLLHDAPQHPLNMDTLLSLKSAGQIGSLPTCSNLHLPCWWKKSG